MIILSNFGQFHNVALSLSQFSIFFGKIMDSSTFGKFGLIIQKIKKSILKLSKQYYTYLG
jgi:hypothetical protein